MIATIQIHRSVNSQYYFNVWSSNGRELARSSETYWNKADCINAARIIHGGGGRIEDYT